MSSSQLGKLTSHVIWHVKYGDFKCDLKITYLDEFIAEMETDIEKPQMEETDWKKNLRLLEKDVALI